MESEKPEGQSNLFPGKIVKPLKTIHIVIVLFGFLSVLSLVLMVWLTPENVEKALGQYSSLWIFLLSVLSLLGLLVAGIVLFFQSWGHRTAPDNIAAAFWAGCMIACILLGYSVLTYETPRQQGGLTQAERRPDLTPPDEWSSMRDYYARNVEDPEPSEYDAARWTMQPISALLVELEDWPTEYNPSMNDFRDSIWWNFFVPTKKRAFTQDEKEAMIRQGFFLEKTAPRGDIAYDDMIDSYNNLYTEGFGQNYSTVPVFISSDFLLHVYHVVYDRMLQDVEERKFYFRLQDLTRKMVDKLHKEMGGFRNPEMEEPIRRTFAFFSVAQRLLDTSFVADPRIASLVNEELEAIESASGRGASVVLGEAQDYTQFKPRGHYTKSARLSRYFRTMMWYGRGSFSLKNDRLTMMALIVTKVWSDAETRNTWRSLSEPINFLIGMPDDLGPEDYAEIASSIYGSDLSENSLPDRQKLTRFVEEARKRARGRIADKPMRETDEPTEVADEFRFLGQRFIPDSYIFTRLTSPRVGNDAKPRNMPKPADVMTILGSPFAEKLVTSDYEIPGYRPNLSVLKSEFMSYPDKTWTQTVYWSWLHSLRAIVAPKDHRYPFFMRGESWEKKSLLTALASWAELRHDTILYSKQSGAEMGEGEEEIPPKPPQPKSYVEPDLEFFNRFLFLVQQTATTLSEHRLLSDEYLQKLSLYLDRLLKLREVVRKELSNAEMSQNEYEMLMSFSGDIANIVIPEGSGDIIEEKYKQMALVADVHTDYFSHRVLEVAIGTPQRIYVAVKDKSGGSRVCVGYVFSYYEFAQPVDQRLTDEEWKEKVYTMSPDIEQKEPVWTKQLRVASR